MVVVPEPAVKGRGAFLAVAVERTVGPAAEQRADEALRLAVGLRPAGARAQMAQPERAARDRVDGRSVARTIVGQHALDGDAVTLEERHGTAHEGDRGGGLLVVEDLGVGQSRAVVDGDVHELPASGAAPPPGLVHEPRGVVPATGPAVSGSGVNAPELLDIDMDQFAGSRALVALGGLKAQPPEPAHPDARQDARD